LVKDSLETYKQLEQLDKGPSPRAGNVRGIVLIKRGVHCERREAGRVEERISLAGFAYPNKLFLLYFSLPMLSKWFTCVCLCLAAARGLNVAEATAKASEYGQH